MEFYMNKRTKQYFICIDSEREGRLLLITPEGRVSSLRENLFDGPYEGDEQQLLSEGRLGLGQIERLEVHKRSKAEEAKLRLETMIDQFPHIRLGERQSHIEKLQTQLRLIQELEEGNI